MAAGLGNRMRPFTAEIPKPFLPVMGVPVIQFAIDSLIDASISDVVVNIHHLPNIARKELDRLDWGSMKVHISDESALLLGSAGGLKKAESFFQNEPFVYLNSDVLSATSVSDLIAKHQQLQKSDVPVKLTLAVHEKSPPGEKYRKMMVSGDRQKLEGFASDVQEFVPFFVGSAVIDCSLLRSMKEEPCDFVPKILNAEIVSKKEVGVLMTDALWMDVGRPATWLDAHFQLIQALQNKSQLPKSWIKRIEKNSYEVKKSVWALKTSKLPKHIENNAYLAIESGSEIEAVAESTVVYGRVLEKTLGPNAIHWNGISASK